MQTLRFLILALLALPAIGCGYTHDSAAYFPADYETSYTVVEECNITGHPRGGFDQVYANTQAHDALENGEAMTEGAVLVKVQWDTDANCSPDGFDIMTVMRKGAKDSAPDVADWEWQTVSPGGSVGYPVPSDCAGCHAACTGYVCTGL